MLVVFNSRPYIYTWSIQYMCKNDCEKEKKKSLRGYYFVWPQFSGGGKKIAFLVLFPFSPCSTPITVTWFSIRLNFMITQTRAEQVTVKLCF